ncbi:MAG: 50S ribosomal protein L9 [Clostridiales bacterium]|nr:50S ribosomal protein L9 [Clostridiales bacterium]MDD7347351.1 50S ribosomal protein L9 [Clostridiales bacterium]MDY4060200.1 50S ribosomal protein L9 [Anaerovoracaceae bacterium]
MIVILKKDVKGTGKAGDVIKVSPGYARNMLIPRGLAVEATEGNVRNLEKQKKLQAEKQAEEKAAAQALADKLSKETILIKTKAGEGGRLFGSITNKDISEAIEKQMNVKIDRRKIVLDSPIKELGIVQVEVKLYPEVTGRVKVDVKEEA